MTIDQIIEVISPYFTVAGVTALVSAVISIAVKVYGIVKKTSQSLSKTALLDEKKIVELMKGVLPTDMSVKVMPLVESELAKINENVQKAAAENATKTAKKLDTIAKAVASMRNLPTEQREQLLAMIEAENKDVAAQTVVLNYEVSEEIKAIAEANKGSKNNFVPVID
jgi:Asp-tRNA(Asn)/Glu-tRNA(Gln) amidotransferase C subunit